MLTAPREIRLDRLELDDARWRALVDEAPGALPFHEPAWSSFLAECYGFRAFALVLAGEDGRAVAGLPIVDVPRPFGGRRWICLPFTDVCVPLGAPDALSALIAAADAERSAAGAAELEIRSAVETPLLFQTTVATRHVLDLPSDPNEALMGFRPSTRQALKVAEREGVRVETAASREALTHVFYDLHVATRRRLGVPVQSRRFFELLWDRVLAPGGGFVLVAALDGRPVAAAVFLAFRDTVVYKFGASDAGAWRVRPNNALFWTAIRQACEEGRRQLDFGRSDHASEGLRRFKASWGAVEQPLVYSSTRPPKAQDLAHGTLARAASFAIRRSPPLVCRALGRAFYRYAA